MKKYFLILFLSCSFAMFSQETKVDFWDHVQFGGGLSMSFGSQTTIGVSPSAIYNFDNGFALGTGLTYIYSKFDDTKTNVYGASIISLYQIPNINIQLSGEYEHSFAKQKSNLGSINTNFPALYLGVAYNNGRFAVGIRYDVLYDDRSVYSSAISPIVRFYF
ncbi:alpha-ketoglutarate decarboxylase [Polaribacter sp. L3A8]|uniref:alpha-ketoglutarate decarboxylase n=1 Tax=Polaribacter sp. L3A8 TaxID=2686361 RepID=UPI00131E6FE7|nr:alpha-ketoglutarate decarboxylase [Polaribacter sp. L3A8]